MKLIVDANVVVKWFLTEPQSDEARRRSTITTSQAMASTGVPDTNA